MNNVSNTVSVTLSPDPVQDDLFIQTKGYSGNMTVSVNDIYGRQVACQIINAIMSSTLDAKAWIPGNYYVHITQDGKDITTRKVTKL